MDLHLPEAPADPKAQRAADRRRLGTAFKLSLAFAAVLAVVFGLQAMGDWRPFAIAPRSVEGLLGILTAPLLHGSWSHLISNTVPLWILGAMARYAYPRALLWALPLIWLASGLGTWLFGRPSLHLGASGVAHGLMFFLFVVGLLRRDRLAIVVALITFFLYGSMIWTVFPREDGVSWEAHLYGAIGGLIAAALLFRRDPLAPRAPYSWEIQPDDDGDDDWPSDDDGVVIDGQAQPAPDPAAPPLDAPARWRLH